MSNPCCHERELLAVVRFMQPLEACTIVEYSRHGIHLYGILVRGRHGEVLWPGADQNVSRTEPVWYYAHGGRVVKGIWGFLGGPRLLGTFVGKLSDRIFPPDPRSHRVLQGPLWLIWLRWLIWGPLEVARATLNATSSTPPPHIQFWHSIYLYCIRVARGISKLPNGVGGSSQTISPRSNRCRGR